MKPLSAMSQGASATSQISNATTALVDSDDLDPNIQPQGSTLVSIPRSTGSASTPSAFAIPGEPVGTIPPIFDGTGGAARRWLKRVELYFFVNQQSSMRTIPFERLDSLSAGSADQESITGSIDRSIGSWIKHMVATWSPTRGQNFDRTSSNPSQMS